jgi:hypothetical protein
MAKKQVSVSLRKPPSPEAVDTFVTSGAAEVPTAPAAPAPKRSRGKKQVAAEKTAVMEVEATPTPPSAAPMPESGMRETEAARAAEAALTIEMAPPAPTPPPPAVEATAPEEPTPAPPVVEATAPEEPAPVAAAEVTPISPVEVSPVEVTTLPPPIMGPNGVPMRPVTIYLPQNLAEKLTVFCIQQDRDLSNVIGEALENHLSPRLGPGTPPPASEHASAGPRASYPPPPYGGRPFWMPEAVWVNPRVEKIVEIGRAVLGVLRRHGFAG